MYSFLHARWCSLSLQISFGEVHGKKVRTPVILEVSRSVPEQVLGFCLVLLGFTTVP